MSNKDKSDKKEWASFLVSKTFVQTFYKRKIEILIGSISLSKLIQQRNVVAPKA